MASISSQIQIVDRMSGPLRGMVTAIDRVVTSLQTMDTKIEGGFDTNQIYEARQAIDLCNAELNEMVNNLQQADKAENGINGNSFRDMADGILSAAAAYMSIQGLQQLAGVSDSLVQTKARLNLVNDGLQTTDELFNQVYASAQRSRAPVMSTADIVAKLGQRAGDVFNNNQETIAFAENLSKMFVIAGASQEEMASASLQLTQALGSGVLRGEELNAVFESAPNVIQTIANYMGVPIGQIRTLASEGKITGEIVKNAMLGATNEINRQFAEMPMTWGQVWTIAMNKLTMATQPLLLAINWLAQNWAVLEPIVIAGATALGLYVAALLVYKTYAGISAALTAISAVSMSGYSISTFMATAAQSGFNAALMSCPITWIIVGIIAIVALIYAFASAIAQGTGVATTGFGVICGAINVVIQFFYNLFLVVANIFAGIGGACMALGYNIVAAFNNAIASVKSVFYSLLSVAMSVISKIAAALSKLPFIEFDAEGLGAAADNYAAKAASSKADKMAYKSIGGAFSEGFHSNDAFSKGWAGSAFKAGASWGDSKIAGLSNMFGGKTGKSFDMKDFKMPGNLADNMNNLGKLGGMADDLGSIKDSVAISQEDLKYLRDIAEREVVNRFTTAEIKVEMNNNNNISGENDIDGIIDKLATGVDEAMQKAAEGVH